MHVGVGPHYRPCLLVGYLTIGHSYWYVATATDSLLVECRRKKDGYKSGATCTQVILHQTYLLMPLRYACLDSATLSDMHAWFMLGSFI